MLSILRHRFYRRRIGLVQKIRFKHFPPPKLTEYYFGYGANLNVERFKNNHMFAEEVGVASLADHEIVINLRTEYLNKGYAGPKPNKGSTLWGVLYRIDRHSLKQLDAMEWCGFGAYTRKLVTVVIKTTGEAQSTWCYFPAKPTNGLQATTLYKEKLLSQSKLRSFPQNYIDQIQKIDTGDHFSIDHEFSLLTYDKRFLAKELKWLYQINDYLREKLSQVL